MSEQTTTLTTTETPKNQAAVELGRRGRGIKKTITPEESERRRQRLAAVRALVAKRREEQKQVLTQQPST